MQSMSILGRTSWALGLTILTYFGFLIREFMVTGTQKAMGIGAFAMILVNPWFWATVVLLLALVFLWRR